MFSLTGRAGRLHHEDIAATHILVDASQEFAVGEVLEVDSPERIAEALRDPLRQPQIGPAAEDLEQVVLVHGRAFAQAAGLSLRIPRVTRGIRCAHPAAWSHPITPYAYGVLTGSFSSKRPAARGRYRAPWPGHRRPSSAMSWPTIGDILKPCPHEADRTVRPVQPGPNGR